jgi:Ni/Co efflux regulator RcnB
MKSKTIALLLVSALVGTSAGAFAQGGPGPDQHGGQDQRGGQDQHGGPGMQHGGQEHGGPGPQGGPQMHADDHRGGPVPHQDWRRGQRLPDDYRDNRYVVNDWHGHGLRRPPRGYEWRQVNGDYVLAAVATGVITSIILSHH